MCGLAAILLHPQERPAGQWQAIKELFTHNLLANEERGQAAAGLAIVRVDGQAAMQKLASPASQFIATTEYCNLLDRLDARTTLLLGHTRYPTKGDPANNANNHPIQVGPIIGIHNGQVTNDDAMFALRGYPRQAQVDSEIIFRLLGPISPAGLDGDYLPAVRAQLRLLQGELTFLASDQRAPEKLLVAKRYNPLSLHYHPEWQALIFSSRYLFLRQTFGPVLLTEHLPPKQLFLFDAQTLPQLGYHPAAALPY